MTQTPASTAWREEQQAIICLELAKQAASEADKMLIDRAAQIIRAFAARERLKRYSQIM